jgi:hypothetical protein
MKRTVIGAAAASAFLAFSGVAFAQQSSGSSDTENVNPCPTGPSCAHCDSVTGEEKERCLRDQNSEGSQPSEVPASSGGTSSTDSASPAASEEDSKAGAAPGGMSPD